MKFCRICGQKFTGRIPFCQDCLMKLYLEQKPKGRANNNKIKTKMLDEEKKEETPFEEETKEVEPDWDKIPNKFYIEESSPDDEEEPII